MFNCTQCEEGLTTLNQTRVWNKTACIPGTLIYHTFAIKYNGDVVKTGTKWKETKPTGNETTGTVGTVKTETKYAFHLFGMTSST
jgi:hypothetical protein